MFWEGGVARYDHIVIFELCFGKWVTHFFVQSFGTGFVASSIGKRIRMMFVYKQLCLFEKPLEQGGHSIQFTPVKRSGGNCSDGHPSSRADAEIVDVPDVEGYVSG